MSFFSEVEKTIERTFRKATEKAFGPAQSDELLLVHRAILEEIEGKIQIVHRGQRLFPYNFLRVKLVSQEPPRRDLFQAAFVQDRRLENDIRDSLKAAGCEIPRGFAVTVETAADGDKGYDIEYAIHEVAPDPEVVPTPSEPASVQQTAPGRLVIVRGKAALETYTLDKARTSIGRMQELTDSQQRVVRRNDIVFEEGGDEANATVSRAHAHIRMENAAEYRICDDESEFGTRIFREGRSIEVPSGNRRGERLRPGDEVYLGRACVRFEQ